MAPKSQKKDVDNNDAMEAANDGGTPETSVVDVNSEAIKALLRSGKERGFVTHDQLNKALPQGELTSEQIEDVMAELNSLGVNVVDHADTDDSEEEETSGEKSSGNLSDEARGSDDPVRMYLREMGSVELLTREGEIAIAKRIEAGRELLLGGICESPLTIRALLYWRDMLDTGEVLLRDLIDLDTTYNRANADPSLNNDPGLPDEMGSGDVLEHASDEEDEDDEEAETSENTEENAEADGDKGETDEMSLSLAAMEDSVRDDVVTLVDQVALTYKELATLRDRRIVTIKRGSQPSVKTETRYQELRILLIEQMDGIILNTNRIEVLLDELFTLNRHLSSLEGQMLRLAEKSGIKRPQFLQHWAGSELLTQWPGEDANTKAWEKLMTKYEKEVTEIRKDIAKMMTEIGMTVPEFGIGSGGSAR